jgi:hypothetical protein
MTSNAVHSWKPQACSNPCRYRYRMQLNNLGEFENYFLALLTAKITEDNTSNDLFSDV